MTASRYWIAGGSVALAGAAGAVLPPDTYLRFVAALVALLGAVLVVFHQFGRSSLALTILVGTAVAFPMEFRGPGGVQFGSSVLLAAALCGLWLLYLLAVRDVTSFDRSRIVVAALSFSGVAIVSFGMGQFPWFPANGAPLPAQIMELGFFLLSVGLFLLASQQLKTLAQLRQLTWVFVATGAVTCVVQILPDLAAAVGRWSTRPGSVGSVFWTWFVAVTVSQGLANRDLPGPVRVLLLGLGALALGHGIIQVRSWASGWVPGLIAVGAILLVRWPRSTVAIGMVAVPLALLVAGDLLATMMVEEQYSLATRQEAWRVLWQISSRNPLFGTGLANYYYYAASFPILGWYVPFISHNNYQDLLIQTGLVGLLTFCWFAAEAAFLSVRLCRRTPPGFASAYAMGVFGGTLGSLASGMLGDWLIPFYYNAGVVGFRSSLLFWVFLGGALALRRMLAAGDTHAAAAAMTVRARPALAIAR